MPPDAARWDAWLTNTGREQIERFLCDGYLARQRWFGSKARIITTVRLVDHFWLPTSASWLLLGCAQVTFSDGSAENYWIFLGLLPIGSARSDLLAWGRLTGAPVGDAVLYEASDDPEASRPILRLLSSPTSMPTTHGQLTPQLLLPLVDDVDLLPVQRSRAEQSNTNLRIGDKYVLKLFRRAVPGLNPDYEIGRFLLERTAFRHVPPLIGAILYQRLGQKPMVLAMLQGWIANQGDGWEYALGQVRRVLENPDALAGAAGWLSDAALLGQRTAELHRALACDVDEPAFRPEEMTDDDLAALRTRMRLNLDVGMSLLAERQTQLPQALRTLAARVLAGRGILEQRLSAALTRPCPHKMRCHGDYHLGQVLRTVDDFCILDFEGEPSRPLAERRAKQSPLKDVAGMLRSFSYAATAGLLARSQERPEKDQGLEAVVRDWESKTACAFLAAYRRTAMHAPFLPASDQQFKALLNLFMLDKALYELVYELNNRPDWVGIPLRGLDSFLTQE